VRDLLCSCHACVGSFVNGSGTLPALCCRYVCCVCPILSQAACARGKRTGWQMLALVSCSSCAPLAFKYCKSLSALLLLAVFAASQQGQWFKACELCSVLNQLISMLMNSTCAGVLGHTCPQQSCRHLLRLQLAAAAAVNITFRLHRCPGSSSCMPSRALPAVN
jgi:hypothetical protein